jgi:2-iminobutanoate/2-iminopropanoate deaminase
MKKLIIETNDAPKAIGPYSQAVSAGGFLFTSGQIPLCRESGQIVGQSVEAQTKKALENLSAVLLAGGSDLTKVVKTTVFIKDMNDFSKINEIYGQFFAAPYPSRSCVEVSRLPKEVLIEIEAVAIV